jgi:hypothetical protein
LKGLKARHIVSRWRKPPEPCEKKYLRPEGPTQQPVCRPFRPQFVDDCDPVARAGSGHRHWMYRPSGPDMRNFKTHASGCDKFFALRQVHKINKLSRVSVFAKITESLDDFRYEPNHVFGVEYA